MRRIGLLLGFLALCLIAVGASRRISSSTQPITEWGQRVVNNGGPRPSQNTMRCMEELRTSLLAQGITNKLYTLGVLVPDSIIAASTPLIRNKGFDPWINTEFGATNLNVDGLKGDGLTKCLDTGVEATNNAAYSNGFLVGMSMVVSESNSNKVSIDMGSRSAGAGENLLLLVSSGGVAGGRTEFYPGGTASGLQFLATNDFVRVGYVSANNMTNAGVTNNVIYIASPLEPHRLYASEPFALPNPQIAGSGSKSVILFGTKQAGTNNISSGLRISAALVHFPFTETESSNVWWALKTCRECLGGGAGDPVKDWARRLVELGGPTLSTTSSNALHGYYSRMGEANLIKDMVVANCYLPDNLFASRTPLIWQAGNQVWTNVAFGETNLTVDGLKGNGTTKYLGTGITPTIINPPFSSISAGLSVLTFEIPASAVMQDFSGSGTAASSAFSAPFNNAGILNFFCFKFVTVNTEFLAITAPSPGATWPGYLSGNRTAANAIRLDWVTNQVHNIATNGTGVQTGSTATITNMFAHASSAPGLVPANFSDHRISYLAIHAGLSQSQSSNQWTAVANLRTNLGGGVP